MITIRPSNERGGGDYGWLKTRHTFSFSDYSDPKWMGFRSLRVINEDWVAPSGGFLTHPHRDMEIITYVLSGKLEHKDSLGTGSVILPGDGQRMSAGRGIRHSEENPSAKEAVHLLQIWILPDTQVFVTLLAPGEEVTQSLAARRHAWLQVAKGEVELDGRRLQQGDGAAVSDEKQLTIKATEAAEVLLFDLA